MSCTIMFHLGGAIRRVGAAETAFEDRRAHHALNINAAWSAPRTSDPYMARARNFWEAMRPYATGGVYVNFLDNEGEERVKAVYGTAKYARLVALKKTHDPTDLFRLNQNIRPTE